MLGQRTNGALESAWGAVDGYIAIDDGRKDIINSFVLHNRIRLHRYNNSCH